jgi:hypothetical protein
MYVDLNILTLNLAGVNVTLSTQVPM